MSASDRVFDSKVLQRWSTTLEAAVVPADARRLTQRFRVLTAHGPNPADPQCPVNVAGLRARRAAWEAYVDVADAVGLLDEDLIERLRTPSDDPFRGAMAEAFAAWFFAARLKCQLVPRPAGRRGAKGAIRQLDFEARNGQLAMNIEIKAPYVAPDAVEVSDIAEIAALQEVVAKAGEQFEREKANVAVVVPEFRFPVDRMAIERALLGQRALRVTVPRDLRAPRVPPAFTFVQDGKLAKLYRDSDQFLPRQTRIGAVMVLKDELPVALSRFRENDAQALRVSCLVVHNPYAIVPIPLDAFGDLPQLRSIDEETMAWSDA